MKFHKRFRTISLYIVSIFVAFSFPLTVFADGTVPPVTSPAEATPVVVQPVVGTTTPTTPTTQTTPTTPVATTTTTTPTTTTAPAITPTNPSPSTTSVTQPTVTIAPVQPANTTTTTVQPADTTTLTSTSGAALVNANSTAGNASSGTAAASATGATVVNSTNSLGTPAIQGSFIKDITGNSTGDITLDPLITQSLQGQGAGTVSTVPGTVIGTVKIDASHSLVVTANSGNATVSNNSTAGNATSGNAIANANVINIINSVLASHGSFVGTINIYGNLNGDILVSPGFLPQLVTGSGGSTQNTSPISANNSSNVGVTNNVSLSAASGNAAVTNNTVAGNATSGQAATNLTVLNVVGQQLNATDSLLVFVNVMGKWVGTIVSSPDGATTAFLATGVQQDTSNPIVMSPIVTSTSTQVTNNITVSAKSGNATVSGNSLAGNATSGNAMASANILNLIHNTMGLSGWLGVLFINVYGNWMGSFGINTPNGNSQTPPDPVVIRIDPGTPTPLIAASIPVKVYRPQIPLAVATNPAPGLTSTPATHHDSGAVLGTSITAPPAAWNIFSLLPYVLIGLVVATAIWLFITRIYRRAYAH